ncbi:hypothetical protein FQN49_007119 [Arthroderma sp. PD_2]|nr:hypothetical protein FQN49_007119 [Arthroderma sp. PD_2]
MVFEALSEEKNGTQVQSCYADDASIPNPDAVDMAKMGIVQETKVRMDSTQPLGYPISGGQYYWVSLLAPPGKVKFLSFLTDFVFTEFINTSGYSSSGLSWLIGQSATAVLFIGYDGACHMAEEVKNARINVPRAMFFTIFINGCLGLAMYIVILFCFGDNIEQTLNTPTGFPFIEIIRISTQSKVATTILTSLLIAMYISATFNLMASASRQAWAFSRDGGLPFSNLFRKINKKTSIPIYTIVLTGVSNGLLSLINIGSTVAFNAIVSLLVSGYMSSYIIVISVMIYKRLTSNSVSFGPWNLGRFGLPINIFAIVYTVITVLFAFFPPTVPVTPENLNYSAVVYGGVVIFGVIYYMTWGHKTFVGPRLLSS